MRLTRPTLTMAILVLASCAAEPEAPAVDEALVNEAPVAEVAAPAPERILAGGGLPGLELFPPDRLESQAMVVRLFETAYANSPSPSGAFERDGIHYDARPHVAFRVGEGLILLVNHSSPANEQIHGDEGSTSVFYFNLDGTGPTRSLPQAIEGTSWGGAADTYLVMLNGAPAAISESGGTWQGYTCGYRTITFFGAQGLSASPAFPGGYSDAGANGGTEISLAGAAPSADGSGLELQYEGYEASGDGTRGPIAIRKSLRFDGRGAEWIQSWPYRC